MVKKLQEKKYQTTTKKVFVKEPQYSIYFPISHKKDEYKTLSVLSLFSGCGGMDLGFEGGFIAHISSINEKYNPDFIETKINDNFVRLKSTKFKTVFANDISKDAQASWVHHFSKLGYDSNIFHSDSIVDLVKMHRNGAKVFPENVDIVTGGFPCQDFSIAGKRKGFESHKNHHGKLIDDEVASVESRGQLYYWMKEVIEITKPKIFIAENVKGLVNLANVKEIIQKDFSSADENGYIVLEPQVLHAADYGVPQSRERVMFIGIRKLALNTRALNRLTSEILSDEYNPYPKPSHAYTNTGNGRVDPQNLKNILNLLSEPENSTDPSQVFYSRAKYMGSHCQGQTEINLEGIGPTIRSEHHGNIEYRRLSKEHGGKIEEELDLGLTERRLTPRECALIQTFPPDYEFVIPKSNSNRQFVVSPSAAYKVIGNAVPPLLAYHLARRIEKIWDLYFK